MGANFPLSTTALAARTMRAHALRKRREWHGVEVQIYPDPSGAPSTKALAPLRTPTTRGTAVRDQKSGQAKKQRRPRWWKRKAAEAAAKYGAGAAGGVAAPATVTWVTGTLAASSTGTPIAVLTGAAAESAILAKLGFGTLAAGGFGIFGGTIVLTGIGVGGFLGAKYAVKKLIKKYNQKKAKKLREKLRQHSIRKEGPRV